MEVPACCPHCEQPFLWELDLTVDREIGWAAPEAPAFLFRCAHCQGLLQIRLGWGLEQGSAPRPLRLAGGPTPLQPAPRILLVDGCPHGCGARVGLVLEPDDPGLRGRVWPDQPLLLGGYRCPRCDGEGRLRIEVQVEPGGAAQP